MRLSRTAWTIIIGVVIAIALYIFINAVVPWLIPLVIGVLAFAGGVFVGRRTAGINLRRPRAAQTTQTTIEGRASAPAKAEQKPVQAKTAETKPDVQQQPAAERKPTEKFEWENWSEGGKEDLGIPTEQEIMARLAAKEKDSAAPTEAPVNDAQAALLERKRRLGLLDDQQK
jgi:hypothetical protein